MVGKGIRVWLVPMSQALRTSLPACPALLPGLCRIRHNARHAVRPLSVSETGHWGVSVQLVHQVLVAMIHLCPAVLPGLCRIWHHVSVSFLVFKRGLHACGGANSLLV